MDKITELKQERASAIKKQRDLVEKAEKEDRNLTSDERTNFNNLDEAIDSFEERIEDLKKIEEREKKIVNNMGGEEKEKETDTEYKGIFDKYTRRGRSALDGTERRALEEGDDGEGGYIVPTEFGNRLMQALEDRNIMRQIASVSSTSSEKKIPVASDSGSATWVSEEGAFSTADASFSQKSVDAYKAGTIIKVSEELLYDNTYNLEGYIQSRFVRRIGDLEEAAFVNGSGTKPTGFLQDADNATTATAADAVTADELIDLYHGPSRPYRKNGAWLMNDGTAKAIRKLKDGNGQYLWQPGLQAGQPDILLGAPVKITGDMPDLGSANKPIAFGDFSFYEIFDREGIFLQRLNELYAENGQIGFRAYKRVDGLLMLAEAVQTITMA